MNQDTLKAIARMIMPGSTVAKRMLVGRHPWWTIKARIPGVKLLQELEWIEPESRKEAMQIAEELNRLSGLPAKRARQK